MTRTRGKPAVAGGRRTAVAILVCAVLVAGCTVPLPGTGEPAQLYLLSPKNTFPSNLPEADWQLLVEETTSPAALDTPRIAVSYSPIEIDYFARANWTDRAPEMVQRLIVESFENSGRIVAVGSDAVGLRTNILLKTELRAFQAEYEGGQKGDVSGKPPSVHIRINAKLVRMPQRVIVASRTFAAAIPAAENAMPAIVRAFDRALDDTLEGIVVWTLTEGRKIMREGDR